MPQGAIKKTARRIGTAKLRNFFRELGPGLITGAADDDPSGISTYSVTGAQFGYGQLWTALFSFPLMAAVQLMCARLGMVTVTAVDVSPDLQNAKIFFTNLAGVEHAAESVELLQHSAGYLRGELAHRLLGHAALGLLVVGWVGHPVVERRRVVVAGVHLQGEPAGAVERGLR